MASNLTAYLSVRQGLAARYARERKQNLVPVRIAPNTEIVLSPGEHSQLIRAVIEEFAARFVPAGVLIYVGDTGDKWAYFDPALLQKLGVALDNMARCRMSCFTTQNAIGYCRSNL